MRAARSARQNFKAERVTTLALKF